MALLTVQTATDVSGSTIVYTQANASDTVKVVDGRTKLLLRTGATGAIQLTLTTYKTVNGLVVPNRVVTGIGTNQDRLFPLVQDLYSNPADGLTTIAITPTTNVTTAVITD